MPPPPQPAAPLPAVPRWRRMVRVVYLLIVVAAFAVAIVARRRELVDQFSELDLLPLLGSMIAGVTGVGISGLIWRRMLVGVGSPLALRPAMRMFFLAQLGKYLPGSVWPVLAQAEMGQDHGIPRRSAVAAQTLFMWVHLVTGGVLGLPVLAAIRVIPWWLGLMPIILIPLLFPRFLGAVLNGLLRRLRRSPLPTVPSGGDMLIATGWALLMWAAYGIHIHLAVDALEFPAPGLLPVVASIGVFAAAWSAGFVFLIAPAGAGAREVVLIAGLSMVTAPQTAFAVTLISRLILTLADGVWGGAGLAAGLRRRREPAARSRGPAV